MFLNHTVDAEGRLKILFRSDGVSQLDYSIFGDVLAFDATYKKNKYMCPLVVFSGVNHHSQSIVFATGIVGNEVEDTYVWLLQQFEEAMKGKMPKSVITDGDAQMRKSIKSVFPSALHRLCAWHLLWNATSNIKNTRFNHLFRKCMLGDYEVDHFESKWNEMLLECDVKNNEWVEDLYGKKEMWATAHMRGMFFGGFRTTSRCEGLNAQIGKYVNYRNNLSEFLENYMQCIKLMSFNEVEADFKSMHGDRVLKTETRALERSASKIYTKGVFLLFRAVLQRASSVVVSQTKQTATHRIFFVTKTARHDLEWHVSYWHQSKDIKCSCLRMESMGIPCDHIVRVLIFLGMLELPSSLVLDRWTKNAKEFKTCSMHAKSSGWDTMVACRYKALNQKCRDSNGEACKTYDDYVETLQVLEAHYERLKKKNGLLPEEGDNVKECDDRFLRDPAIAKTKGRGRGKGGHKKRSVHCGYCGLVGHNKQTCPSKANVLEEEDEETNIVDDEDEYSNDDE